LRDFALGLLTNVLTVLLDFFLIDRIIRRREEQQRKRYRSIALQQFRRPLAQHLSLLADIYKASVERKPDKEPKLVADLFCPDYLSQLAHFDLTGSAPVTAHMQWWEYIRLEGQKFETGLSRIVDKHALYLDPDTLEAAEELINSPFIHMAEQLLPAMAKNVKGPLLLLGDIFRDDVSEHLRLLSRLIDIHNEEVSPERQILVKENLWNDTIAPGIGSARATRLEKP
jgi:hypothetical protein